MSRANMRSTAKLIKFTSSLLLTLIIIFLNKSDNCVEAPVVLYFFCFSVNSRSSFDVINLNSISSFDIGNINLNLFSFL